MARVLVLPILLLMAAAPVSAAECGDKAGPGGSDVPCSCGDTLVTSVELSAEDPVVYTGGGDTPCAGDGLVVAADGVWLDCRDEQIHGGATGTGIATTGFDGLKIQDCHVYGFEHGIHVTDSK